MPLLITGVVSLAEETDELVVLLDPVEPGAGGDLFGDMLLLLLPLDEGLRLMTLDGDLLVFFLSVS